MKRSLFSRKNDTAVEVFAERMEQVRNKLRLTDSPGAEIDCKIIALRFYDKVYLPAASAGGSVAIRFALDYPERTKGLILYSSAMPFTEKPEKYSEYAGPPAFICNDFMMYLISSLFEPIMGMEPSTIYSMLPVGERKDGVVPDASVTNIDMARNYDDYHVEDLQVPTLVFHAKDDKLASFADAEKAVGRFPNCTFISFESGGHLMEGHEEEIKEAVLQFTGEQQADD